MWIVIFSALSAVIACLACLGAGFAAQRARRDVGLPRAKLLSAESRLALIERSHNGLAEVVTELANRVKMMKVRSAVRHGSSSTELPDPHTDPNGWRKAMNLRIAERKLSGTHN